MRMMGSAARTADAMPLPSHVSAATDQAVLATIRESAIARTGEERPLLVIDAAPVNRD